MSLGRKFQLVAVVAMFGVCFAGDPSAPGDVAASSQKESTIKNEGGTASNIGPQVEKLCNQAAQAESGMAEMTVAATAAAYSATVAYLKALVGEINRIILPIIYSQVILKQKNGETFVISAKSIEDRRAYDSAWFQAKNEEAIRNRSAIAVGATSAA